jgi:hypothetical protein
LQAACPERAKRTTKRVAPFAAIAKVSDTMASTVENNTFCAEKRDLPEASEAE